MDIISPLELRRRKKLIWFVMCLWIVSNIFEPGPCSTQRILTPRDKCFCKLCITFTQREDGCDQGASRSFFDFQTQSCSSCKSINTCCYLSVYGYCILSRTTSNRKFYNFDPLNFVKHLIITKFIFLIFLCTYYHSQPLFFFRLYKEVIDTSGG